MSLVPVEHAARLAERLLEIIREAGGEPIPLEGVEEGVLSLWKILECLAEPASYLDPDDPETRRLYTVGAGIHDLAAKIVPVWDDMPKARPVISKHVKLLSELCYVGKNSGNPRWDRFDGHAREHGSADKVIELYWACLCILAGMSVEVDDPYESSGGTNPDVIATAADGTRWAFALKTLAETMRVENAARNLLTNVQKGVKQIDRSACDKGVVVMNLKNVVDHAALHGGTAYSGWEAADGAMKGQIGLILTRFYGTEAVELAPTFASRGRAAPLVILVAHTTVLVRPTGSPRKMFTEMRTMIGASVPGPDQPPAGTLGREAHALAEDFNHFMQIAT